MVYTEPAAFDGMTILKTVVIDEKTKTTKTCIVLCTCGVTSNKNLLDTS